MQMDFSIESLSDFGYPPECIPAIKNNGITELREIQLQTIKRGLLDGNSFLISTPSGSGKTLVGELAIIHNIMKFRKKALFLVPLRALAAEKYHHFNQSYSNLNISVAMAVGDMDLPAYLLKRADLLIMTYEKFDSFMRMGNQNWIQAISTIVIDEVHIVGSLNRGPRLENLIVQIYHLFTPPQLILLSATIANPDSIISWLNYLERKYRFRDFQNIIEKKRPIELKYQIIQSSSKIKKIYQIIDSILKDDGQVLIFTNSRNDTQKLAEQIQSILFQPQDSQKLIDDAIAHLDLSISDISRDLLSLFPFQIAFHHAGLNPSERMLVESLFRSGLLKILASTTTLSTGINTPARAVILKDFRKFQVIDSEDNIPQYNKIPLDRNMFHQICGRAGRPGFDPVGYAFILVDDVEQEIFVRDTYFDHSKTDPNLLSPKFDDLHSSISLNRDLLSEILLLYTTNQGENGLFLPDFVHYVQDMLIWQEYKDFGYPIEVLLNLSRLNFTQILKAFISRDLYLAFKNIFFQIEISKLESNQLTLSIKLTSNETQNITKYAQIVNPNSLSIIFDSLTQEDTHQISIFVNRGIKCSCGVKLKPEYLTQSTAFAKLKVCPHILATIFVFKQIYDDYLIKGMNYLTNSIYSLKFSNTNQSQFLENLPNLEEFMYYSLWDRPIIRILNAQEMIYQADNVGSGFSQYFVSPLGKLALKCYILPNDAFLLKNKLEELFFLQNSLYLTDLIPIINNLIQSQFSKYSNFLLKILNLWISEKNLLEISTFLRQKYDFLVYSSDLQNLIEHVSRLLKFISEYVLIFHSDWENHEFPVLYLRIKYGILSDLVPWIQIFKNEDPVLIRKIKISDNSLSSIFSNDSLPNSLIDIIDQKTYGRLRNTYQKSNEEISK